VEYDYSETANFFTQLVARKSNVDREKYVFMVENFNSLLPPKKEPADIVGKLKKAAIQIEKLSENERRDLALTLRKFNDKCAARPKRTFFQNAISLRRKGVET
jgi:hypothetical protein